VNLFFVAPLLGGVGNAFLRDPGKGIPPPIPIPPLGDPCPDEPDPEPYPDGYVLFLEWPARLLGEAIGLEFRFFHGLCKLAAKSYLLFRLKLPLPNEGGGSSRAVLVAGGVVGSLDVEADIWTWTMVVLRFAAGGSSLFRAIATLSSLSVNWSMSLLSELSISSTLALALSDRLLLLKSCLLATALGR
jgi:hypothetical protein